MEQFFRCDFNLHKDFATFLLCIDCETENMVCFFHKSGHREREPPRLFDCRGGGHLERTAFTFWHPPPCVGIHRPVPAARHSGILRERGGAARICGVEEKTTGTAKAERERPRQGPVKKSPHTVLVRGAGLCLHITIEYCTQKGRFI